MEFFTRTEMIFLLFTVGAVEVVSVFVVFCSITSFGDSVSFIFVENGAH